MKPRNAIYLGDRALDPPEYVVMIRCTGCHKSAYSAEWISNHGDCPRCQKAYQGKLSED